MPDQFSSAPPNYPPGVPYFLPPDPTTGFPGSQVRHSPLNYVYGGLGKLCEAAGIQVNLQQYDQLLRAIEILGGSDLAQVLATTSGGVLSPSTLALAPSAGNQLSRRFTATGKWFAGLTTEAPTTANTVKSNGSPEPNDYEDLPTPEKPYAVGGHMWPYMSPTSMMRSASGGNYPACYKATGLNRYQHCDRVPAGTFAVPGGGREYGLLGDYFGTDTNRMLEILLEPALDLQVGFNPAKGVAFQIGPINGPVGATFSRWEATVTAKVLQYFSTGVTTIQWHCKARFGTNLDHPGVNNNWDYDEIKITNNNLIDWTEPQWMAVLFKTDTWGDALGVAGTGAQNGSSVVRASQFEVGPLGTQAV